MMPSSDTLPILSVRNLSTGYGKKQVLFDVSLDVMPGEIVLITGGNGSGKSTLLKAIYGLLPAWNDDAEILYRPDRNGSAVSTSIATDNLAQGLAYLPQKNAVFDDLTVEDNLRLAGHILRDVNEFANRRDEVLTSLPVLATLLKRKPEKMSGGERQMVALGMVLLHRPRLLLLDEPFGGLDNHAVEYMERILGDLHQNKVMSLVVIEHRRVVLPESQYRKVRLMLGNIVAQEDTLLCSA